MSQTLGQPIVVEDITGAGGSIGAARVARALPDGYTLVMGNLGTHAAAVGLYKNLSYDPRTDFESIMLVASTPMVLDLRPGFPAKSLKEFTEYAKTHSLTSGSAGIGSISHLTYFALRPSHRREASACAVSRSIRSDERTAWRTGRYAIRPGRDLDPQIIAGKVIPLAITTTARAPSIPNVPTSVEAGMPDLQTIAWSALFAPKGTPRRSSKSSMRRWTRPCTIRRSSRAANESAPICRRPVSAPRNISVSS